MLLSDVEHGWLFIRMLQYNYLHYYYYTSHDTQSLWHNHTHYTLVNKCPEILFSSIYDK